MTEKSIRTYTVIVSLVIMILAFLLEFYIPNILSNQALSSFNTSETKRFLSTLVSLLYGICFAAIITVFISSAIQKSGQKHFLDQLNSKIEEIKTETLRSVYGLSIEPEIWALLEDELFRTKTIRKNMYLSITFSVDENEKISEKMVWRYDLFNRSNEDIEHKITISTTDRYDRVVLEKVSYVDIDEEKFSEKTVTKDPVSIISRHDIYIPVKKKHTVCITNTYSLNLGIEGSFYQNTIGIKEFLIGLHVDIHKPAGYLFAIELYSKNELVSSQKIDTIEDNNTNETYLSYHYNRALFPATGLEYSLERVS